MITTRTGDERSTNPQPYRETSPQARRDAGPTNGDAMVRLGWIDALKGVALLWVVTNHVVERIFGAAYLGDPSFSWPPLAQRVAQLAPLTGHGWSDVLANVVRYIGWTGDTGVGLFLLLSGFGLTFALARAGTARLDVADFYKRRALRIVPLWWGVHIFFALTWLLTGWGIEFTHKAMYLSMFGLRFTPGLFTYFSPSWWFIGMLVQLYLVFPLLWALLRARGPLATFAISCAIGIAARLCGLLMHGYLPEWERGAVFLTRLPEFVAGMSLAVAWAQQPRETVRLLMSPLMTAGGALMFLAGAAASLTLLGTAIAPIFMTIGSFLAAFGPIARIPDAASAWLRWLGEHSYSLYLVHQPLIALIVPAGAAFGVVAGGIGLGARIALALGLALLLALFLERTTSAAVNAVLRRWRVGGWLAVAARSAAVVAACIALIAAVELVVERFWPQEVYGWAERPALQPDAALGWRLTPNTTTRLRWMGYDYTVVSNDLGFPAPSFAATRPPHTFRIMTLGDAFTSAEGLDTDQSWPRLLQERLDSRAGELHVQVLNFAVTGYGPAQFDSVARQFVPRYRPDVVIIGFFVKDFGDVLLPGQMGAARVGFDLPPLPAWKRVLLMYHMRKLLQDELLEPLDEAVTGAPRAEGYALGNIEYFERNRADLTTVAPPLVERRLADVAAIDRQAGARTIILMIPASVQVCSPGALPYFPTVLALQDGRRFDLDLPQRETQAIATRLGLATYDLRPALAALPECPYAARNMHWTQAGQQAAAAFVANKLVTGGVLSTAHRERPAGNRT